MHKTAIVILAAGSSSRLGTPKQLLLYKNKPLLLHTVDAALAARLYPVTVITGYDEVHTSAILKDHHVNIIHNPCWQEGMASGISLGLNAVLQDSYPVDSIIIAVCDQPYVYAGLFHKMIDARVASGKSIVACSYAGTAGVPVLFAKKYFDALLELQGNDGAKKLLKRYHEDLCMVDFPMGEVDIDTMEDYGNLII
jgi:molybdenum cofactor cytidylyltransferase